MKDQNIIIPFDNGHNLDKTKHDCYENALTFLGALKPCSTDNILLYKGNYYQIGGGRNAITDDNISDETTRIKTMVAIAKELKNLGLTSATIVLAVGLPLKEYGKKHQQLIDYYNSQKELTFVYEDIEYHVIIDKVVVCAQGYAAVASRIESFKKEKEDYLVVDIGSKTVDLAFFKAGIYSDKDSRTIPNASIKWLQDIKNKVYETCSEDLDEDKIIKVLLENGNNTHSLSNEVIDCINVTAKRIINDFILELAEKGYKLSSTNIIFVGGGSQFIKKYSAKDFPNAEIIDDLKANAKGYELIAKSILIHSGKEGGSPKYENGKKKDPAA